MLITDAPPELIADTILAARRQVVFVTEAQLQKALVPVFANAGIPAEREANLSDGVSRIDFLVGRVGVEIKTKGTWAAVTRQLLRYSHCPEIDSLILVTSKAAHNAIPREIGGKPVLVVSLVGAA
ncbi:hypothetical protein GCM10025867_49460 (plasmid) [Frondihabitans sucicola]|uniref:Restriction endonuclease n=1 Tax=Frondihabitans sucicola TaxID=1268041 RepID=A0ABM8GW48_9MICO|nr:hypothetical protein [Frondihabitans sucicola]BDZ52705.1 hypothetical protein GCM10025867_49460 [Frondihabitans sucicola]